MDRLWIGLGSFVAFLGVGSGAFGAHALREVLSVRMLAVYQTAVQYQLIHALALIAIGCVARGAASERLLGVAGTAIALGVLLFCGSLYALALTGVTWLGMVTPVGGVSLLVGWLSLLAAILRAPRDPADS